MSERLNMETRMLREAQEAPQVVARLLESNAPLYRDLGERLRGDHGDVTARHGWDSPGSLSGIRQTKPSQPVNFLLTEEIKQRVTDDRANVDACT
jgi:hypothetical protein